MPSFYGETYKRVIELRPDFAEKRREKIFTVFRKLIEEGIEAGEFRAVDSNEAANVLKDASAIFLHPLMIPTVLKEDHRDAGGVMWFDTSSRDFPPNLPEFNRKGEETASKDDLAGLIPRAASRSPNEAVPTR